jgi:nicotinamidase-related amidase
MVIIKKAPSSFVGTNLEEELKIIGRKNLILAGFMTHMCIHSTAQGAFNRGN